MRSLSDLKKITDSVSLISFMQEDHHILILLYGNDLSHDEFHGFFSTRSDSSILLIYSLRLAGAKNIGDICRKITLRKKYMAGHYPEEVSVIGKECDRTIQNKL